MKINWNDVRLTLGNFVKALFKGELLLRLGADRYFPHILYTFVIGLAMIWVSMRIDRTLTRVEQNKTVIENLRIEHAEKTAQLARVQRMGAVRQRLKEMGSPLDLPEKPATMMKRRK